MHQQFAELEKYVESMGKLAAGALANEVCICGCTKEEHEWYEEGGTSCPHVLRKASCAARSSTGKA